MSGRVFDALGDATRREILETLGPTEQSAGMIVAALQARRPISQPAVSQHLKSLHDAGLVTVRNDATKRIYAIDHAALDAAHDWLTLLVEPVAAFTQPLDALETEIARGQRSHKQQGASAHTTNELSSRGRLHA